MVARGSYEKRSAQGRGTAGLRLQYVSTLMPGEWSDHVRRIVKLDKIRRTGDRHARGSVADGNHGIGLKGKSK